MADERPAQRPPWTLHGPARAVLGRWPGLSAAPMRHVTFGENATWRVAGPDGPLALRIYRPGRWSAEQVVVEHRLMGVLGPGLGVRPPVPGRDGETLQRVPGTDLLAALFPWVPGRLAGRRPGLPRLELLGQYVGLLHGRLAQRPLAGDERHWDEESLVTGPLRTARERWAVELPDQPFPRVLVEQAPSWLDRWRRLGSARALLHADLHLGNLKWDGETLGCIDFDDCGVAPLAYDLAIPALGCRGERHPAVLDALLAGYAATAPRPADRSEVLLFMAIRRLWGMGWVSERPELFEPGRLGRILKGSAETIETMVAAGQA